MGWSIDYLEKDNIVCVKITGLMDWNLHRTFCKEVFPLVLRHGSQKIFIDFTEMVPDFTVLQIDDMPRLLRKDCEARPEFRIAGLYDESSPHTDEFVFFQNAAYIESINVQYFTSRDDALAWLKSWN